MISNDIFIQLDGEYIPAGILQQSSVGHGFSFRYGNKYIQRLNALAIDLISFPPISTTFQCIQRRVPRPLRAAFAIYYVQKVLWRNDGIRNVDRPVFCPQHCAMSLNIKSLELALCGGKQGATVTIENMPSNIVPFGLSTVRAEAIIMFLQQTYGE